MPQIEVATGEGKNGGLVFLALRMDGEGWRAKVLSRGLRVLSLCEVARGNEGRVFVTENLRGFEEKDLKAVVAVGV